MNKPLVCNVCQNHNNCTVMLGTVYSPFYVVFNMLLVAESAITELPPIVFCNEFLLGGKYDCAI